MPACRSRHAGISLQLGELRSAAFCGYINASAAPLGASHQAAVRTLAIAIRYDLRLNHLRWYYITDREPTGRYPDKRLSACLAPTGFPRLKRLCSPANLPGLGNKDGISIVNTNKKSNR